MLRARIYFAMLKWLCVLSNFDAEGMAFPTFFSQEVCRTVHKHHSTDRDAWAYRFPPQN